MARGSSSVLSDGADRTGRAFNRRCTLLIPAMTSAAHRLPRNSGRAPANTLTTSPPQSHWPMHVVRCTCSQVA